MVSEVPITTVLEMWDKVQTKAVLLVEAVASLSSSNQGAHTSFGSCYPSMDFLILILCIQLITFILLRYQLEGKEINF